MATASHSLLLDVSNGSAPHAVTLTLSGSCTPATKVSWSNETWWLPRQPNRMRRLWTSDEETNDYVLPVCLTICPKRSCECDERTGSVFIARTISEVTTCYEVPVDGEGWDSEEFAVSCSGGSYVVQDKDLATTLAETLCIGTPYTESGVTYLLLEECI